MMLALDAVIIFLGILAGTGLRAVPHIDDSAGISLLMFASVSLVYVGIFAASIVTIIFITMRFYRNLYTSEGYLTFTLPVKTDLIIHSKVITGTLWMFLCYICMITAIILAGSGFVSATNAAADEVVTSFGEMYSFMGFQNPGLIAALIITFIITPFATVVNMYFCVSIGQLWQSHKILGTILCVIGLYVFNQILSMGIMFGSGFWQLLTLSGEEIDAMIGGIYTKIMLSISIMTLIESIIFYVVSLIINRKKVNLD